MEPVPPPQLHPLDYGGSADRHAGARERRFRARAVVGICCAALMAGVYGVLLLRDAPSGDELPFVIVIAIMGALPAAFLLAGCVGTFFPAPWARLTILFGCYALVGGSIIQALAYLPALSVVSELAIVGMAAVVAQLGLAAYYLYVFHDEVAIDFYGG